MHRTQDDDRKEAGVEQMKQTIERDAAVVRAIGERLQWTWQLEAGRRDPAGTGEGLVVTASVPIHLRVFVPDEVDDDHAAEFARSAVGDQLWELARQLSSY